ncbi:hypothetical protein BDR04DRAFT_1088267 [Suillus decipiens]|nr:hypothetical protein BDR04DRAFT_1088267 [Suillus decipiens]
MARTTTNKNAHFSIFPSAPASTNISVLFGRAQSPRDNHEMCEDLRKVFVSNRRATQNSGSGCFKGLKKILGAT